MSEWIAAAASSAVWPRRSGQARVSFSPAVKNVIRSSSSRRRRATSSSAEGAPSRNAAASSSEARRARPRARGRSRRARSRPRSAASSSAARARPAARRRRPRAACPASTAARTSRSRSTSARSFGSPDFACFSTRSSRPATWSRSATSSSRLQVLEVAGRIGARREAVEHDEQRVDLAEVAEQRRPGARDVLDADRDRRDLLGRDDLRRARRGAASATSAMPTFVLPYSPPPVRVSAREERRLARTRQADDPGFERHGWR